MNNPANPWIWTAGSAPLTADATKPGFSFAFLQTLMPAKWQAVYFPDVLCFRGFYGTNPCNHVSSSLLPYDLIANALPQNGSYPRMSYRFLNEIGDSPSLVSPGYLPTQELIQTILNLGVSQETLFSGTGGWNLKVVPGVV